MSVVVDANSEDLKKRAESIADSCKSSHRFLLIAAFGLCAIYSSAIAMADVPEDVPVAELDERIDEYPCNIMRAILDQNLQGCSTASVRDLHGSFLMNEIRKTIPNAWYNPKSDHPICVKMGDVLIPSSPFVMQHATVEEVFTFYENYAYALIWTPELQAQLDAIVWPNARTAAVEFVFEIDCETQKGLIVFRDQAGEFHEISGDLRKGFALPFTYSGAVDFESRLKAHPFYSEFKDMTPRAAAKYVRQRRSNAYAQLSSLPGNMGVPTPPSKLTILALALLSIYCAAHVDSLRRIVEEPRLAASLREYPWVALHPVRRYAFVALAATLAIVAAPLWGMVLAYKAAGEQFRTSLGGDPIMVFDFLDISALMALVALAIVLTVKIWRLRRSIYGQGQ